MATLEQLLARREDLAERISSGVLKLAGHGKTTEFRSLDEMQQALFSLDAQIAAARSTKPVRRIYVRGSKDL